MIISTHTGRAMAPPTEQQRIDAYQARLRSHGHYNRHVHDARIRGGMAWRDAFMRRPIPRHRALTVQPAGDATSDAPPPLALPLPPPGP